MRASRLIAGVVAIQTDVALPDSVDRIRIEVIAHGTLQFGNDFTVGPPPALRIPATLGLIEGADPSTPVLVRLIARKGGDVKMLREVVTKIPQRRVVMLRMPIRWLCDDSAKETSPGVIANAKCLPIKPASVVSATAMAPTSRTRTTEAMSSAAATDRATARVDSESEVLASSFTVAQPPRVVTADANNVHVATKKTIGATARVERVAKSATNATTTTVATPPADDIVDLKVEGTSLYFTGMTISNGRIYFASTDKLYFFDPPK